MSFLNNRRIVMALKFYVGAALIVAAIFSSPVTSVVAILALAVYIFFQWRPINIYTGVMVHYFIFFGIAILLAPVTNFLISTLISLPILFLVTNSLINIAGLLTRRITRHSRSLTLLGIILPFISIVNLLLALFLGNMALSLASCLAIIYLAFLCFLSLKKLSGESIVVEQIEQRVIAGSTADSQLNLHAKTKWGAVVYLEALYDWVKIHTPVFPFKPEPLVLKMSVSPLLSGPSEVLIKGYAIDYWGLTQIQFQLAPIKLHIIPRARYAIWLAKKYLQLTKQGMLPLISNVSTIRPQYGFRRGIEYYGSKLYQSGDEMKSIDWKHSAKYNRMITKEFVEFNGQPAVLLVNLAVSDAEEADELAQKTIVTALSLAQEQIPTVIAAYDQNGIKRVTQTLQPHQLVMQSMEITRQIIIFENPTKYLYAPDIGRLRANINRLKALETDSSRALSQLMGIEITSFMNGVIHNPATKAINKALNNANIQSTIVIVSRLNHDANAIEVNKFIMTRRGYAVLAV